MNKIRKSKKYDLEDRTKRFSKDVRILIKKLPRTVSNIEDAKQLVRSSGSIGANYIEANEAFSKKDFIHRIKISRKEAKESIYWLELVDISDSRKEEHEIERLVNEATELMKIFSSIMRKSTQS
jgi:four helix bundle protein